ncbi:MAG: exo-beta-N-acetylmuramidase NamZ domain-containing protein [Chitinophagales bacterium]
MKSYVIFFCIAVQPLSLASHLNKERDSYHVGNEIIIPASNRFDCYLPLLQKKSVAIFANQTSILGNSHLVDTLLKRGVLIKKIFAPEHGFRGTGDAGEGIGNLVDSKTGLPIISLYGNKVKPSAEDLRDVDIMLFDIQDVGTRFYTYISSFQKYLEAAIENNKWLIILDRPNPNGFYVDGPVLDTAFKSFVGMQPIPVVYGMTIGEYATMLIKEKWIPAKYTGINIWIDKEWKKNGNPGQLLPSEGGILIVKCSGYTHRSKYKLPIKPSPNLPNMQSIYLYPSLCFFEGTAISLGRGTDKPFQQFGNPLFPKNLYQFTPKSLPGAKTPPLLNQACYGYDLSKISQKEFTGQLQLKWLLRAYKLYPDKKNFFLESNFFNKLAGSDKLKDQIISGKTEDEIRRSWKDGISRFKAIRKKYLLYPDFE